MRKKIEALITERTRAIAPVHYAGVACEMDVIMDIAKKHDLLVVEDAAQAVNAFYKGRALGSIGHFGLLQLSRNQELHFRVKAAPCWSMIQLSFCDPKFFGRRERTAVNSFEARLISIHGRSMSAQVSCLLSWLPAFLHAQLEHADQINIRRLEIWDRYNARLAELEAMDHLRRPKNMTDRQHNGHMFYVILKSGDEREKLIAYLREHEVHAVFHYVPLHSSPMSKKLGLPETKLPVTEKIAECLLRLPCYFGLGTDEQDQVIDLIFKFFGRTSFLEQFSRMCSEPITKSWRDDFR